MNLGDFSLNATIWFPGSAWEPNALEVPPAEAPLISGGREAEPPRQCVPRQEPGNECVRGGVRREVSNLVKVVCLVCVWLVPLVSRAQTVTLQARDLNESSGLAQVGERLWSHNDSGDRPRLFVFAKSGELISEIEIVGAQALDWEDMCVLTRDGRHYVAVGDVGDNLFNRDDVRIYVIEVPTELLSSQTRVDKKLQLSVAAEFRVTYPDGAVNCEALAYDPLTESFVLATKEFWRCRLVSVPASRLEGVQSVTAQWIGTVMLPLVTGGDISPDGSRLVLSTYGPGCLIGRHRESGKEKEWLTDRDEAITMFALPTRKQGESICFSRDGQHLFLTSEFVPTPLFEIPLP